MLTCDKCKRGKPGDGVFVDRSAQVMWVVGANPVHQKDRNADICQDCKARLTSVIGKTVSDFFGET